jgi:hypothetical protein
LEKYSSLPRINNQDSKLAAALNGKAMNQPRYHKALISGNINIKPKKPSDLAVNKTIDTQQLSTKMSAKMSNSRLTPASRNAPSSSSLAFMNLGDTKKLMSVWDAVQLHDTQKYYKEQEFAKLRKRKQQEEYSKYL